MADPGFLRGREWLIKPKVQGRSKKRVKQMKRAWWSVWRADTVLVDIQEGNWISQVIGIKKPESSERRDEAWKWVI